MPDLPMICGPEVENHRPREPKFVTAVKTPLVDNVLPDRTASADQLQWMDREPPAEGDR